MKILIKLGGTLLDAAESRHRLAAEIAAAARMHRVTVVHGGGKQMTRFLAERGLESRFVNGLLGLAEEDAPKPPPKKVEQSAPLLEREERGKLEAVLGRPHRHLRSPGVG